MECFSDHVLLHRKLGVICVFTSQRGFVRPSFISLSFIISVWVSEGYCSSGQTSILISSTFLLYSFHSTVSGQNIIGIYIIPLALIKLIKKKPKSYMQQMVVEITVILQNWSITASCNSNNQ